MTEWARGRLIPGDCLIERELGRGGMGRVWLAKSNANRPPVCGQTVVTCWF